jgi:hypothetical protein
MNSTQAFYIHGLRLRYIHGRTIHPPLNHTAFAVGYKGGIPCFCFFLKHYLQWRYNPAKYAWIIVAVADNTVLRDKWMIN